MAMKLEDAIKTIEKCSGFSDESTLVGEAWKLILEKLKYIRLRNIELPGPGLCGSCKLRERLINIDKSIKCGCPGILECKDYVSDIGGVC